jgi:hypothetical protein
MRVLRRLWRGEYSLLTSFFGFYCGGIVVVWATVYSIGYVIGGMMPGAAFDMGGEWVLVGLGVAAICAYSFIAAVGAVRAAARGHGKYWGIVKGTATGITCLGIFWGVSALATIISDKLLGD